MIRPDNPRREPERPLRVARDDLEQALRETLARQVVAPRSLAVDPAGPAIRRADRMQRRRTLTGVALAAVATVVVSTGMAQFGAGPGQPTAPVLILGEPSGPPGPSTPPPPGVEVAGPVVPKTAVVAGGALITDEGRRLDLGGIGRVERVVPVGQEGWLLVSSPTPAGRTLWSVRRAGGTQVLLAGADAVAGAPDGRRAAWRDGPDIFVADVVGLRLLPAARTPATATADPVGFVGGDVLVRLHPDRPGFVLLPPQAEALPGDTFDTVLDVYGRTRNGMLVTRAVAGDGNRQCLALVDPDPGPDTVDPVCALDLSAAGSGVVSSDGRFLLVNRKDGAGDQALLVDLGQPPGTQAVARPVGPPLAGAAVWSGPELVYPAVDGTLARLRTDRPAEPATTIRVPGQAAGDRPVLAVPGTI